MPFGGLLGGLCGPHLGLFGRFPHRGIGSALGIKGVPGLGSVGSPQWERLGGHTAFGVPWGRPRTGPFLVLEEVSFVSGFVMESKH